MIKICHKYQVELIKIFTQYNLAVKPLSKKGRIENLTHLERQQITADLEKVAVAQKKLSEIEANRAKLFKEKIETGLPKFAFLAGLHTVSSREAALFAALHADTSKLIERVRPVVDLSSFEDQLQKPFNKIQLQLENIEYQIELKYAALVELASLSTDNNPPDVRNQAKRRVVEINDQLEILIATKASLHNP